MGAASRDERCGSPPDTKRCRPAADRAASQRKDAAEATFITSVTARTVKCAYLHPRHLTGCRNQAEPGSRYCAEHQDGAR